MQFQGKTAPVSLRIENYLTPSDVPPPQYGWFSDPKLPFIGYLTKHDSVLVITAKTDYREINFVKKLYIGVILESNHFLETTYSGKRYRSNFLTEGIFPKIVTAVHFFHKKYKGFILLEVTQSNHSMKGKE